MSDPTIRPRSTSEVVPTVPKEPQAEIRPRAKSTESIVHIATSALHPAESHPSPVQEYVVTLENTSATTSSPSVVGPPPHAEALVTATAPTSLAPPPQFGRVSNAWFRFTLTDKKAQSVVTDFAKKIRDIRAIPEENASTGQKADAIVSHLATPRSLQALHKVATEFMREGTHKQEFIALLADLGRYHAAGSSDDQSRLLAHVCAAKILGLMQETHFEHSKMDSECKRFLGQFSASVLTVVVNLQSMAVLAGPSPEDKRNVTILLTNEGLARHVKQLDPARVTAMLTSGRILEERGGVTSTRDNRLALLCGSNRPAEGANETEKMAYGQWKYKELVDTLKRITDSGEYSQVGLFRIAGTEIASALPYLVDSDIQDQWPLELREAMQFFTAIPEGTSAQTVFENYVRLAQGLAVRSSDTPFEPLRNNLEATSRLAEKLILTSNIQLPLSTLASFNAFHPFSELVSAINIGFFRGVANILNEPSQTEENGILDQLVPDQPLKGEALQQFSTFLEKVANDLELREDVPISLKDNIGTLQNECRSQMVLSERLEKLDTFRYPKTAGADIMRDLGSWGSDYSSAGYNQYEGLIGHFLEGKPEHEQAIALLNSAASLARRGEEAKSLLALSKALTLVVDHADSTTGRHALYSVRCLRNKLEATYGCAGALADLKKYERPATNVKGEMDAFRQLAKPPPRRMMDRLMRKKAPAVITNVYATVLPKEFTAKTGGLISHDLQNNDPSITPVRMPGYDHSIVPGTRYDAYSVPLQGINRQAIMCAHPKTDVPEEEAPHQSDPTAYYKLLADPNNDVSTIINVAMASESSGRHGAAFEYWPKEEGQSMSLGGVTMTCVNADRSASAPPGEGHSIYTLQIAQEGHPPKEVKMFHYENWPDRTTATPDKYDAFMDKLITDLPPEGTILAHCMAGKGRSGTALASLEIGTQLRNRGDKPLSELPVNIERTIGEKRLHRVDFVQQLEQLSSIHGYVNREVANQQGYPTSQSGIQRALLGRSGPATPSQRALLREVPEDARSQLVQNRVTLGDYQDYKKHFPEADLSRQTDLNQFIAMYRKEPNSHSSYGSIVRSLSRSDPEARAVIGNFFSNNYEAASFLIPVMLGKWNCSHAELVDRFKHMHANNVTLADFQRRKPFIRSLVAEIEQMTERPRFEGFVTDLAAFDYGAYAVQLTAFHPSAAPFLDRMGSHETRNAFLETAKSRAGLTTKMVGQRIDSLFTKINNAGQPEGTLETFFDRIVAYEGENQEVLAAKAAITHTTDKAEQAKALVNAGFLDGDGARWSALGSTLFPRS